MIRAMAEKLGYTRTPDRVCRISERGFWGSWKATATTPALKEAVRLGLAGRKSAAYLSLAAHHRATTAADWKAAVEEARRRWERPADRRKFAAQADDLRRGTIHLWHELTLKPGGKIDFRRAAGRSGLYGLHYMYWMAPLVDRCLLEGDPGDLARIIDIVEQYYTQRLGIPRPFPNLDPVYYELGASVKIQTLAPAYLALVRSERPSPRAMEAFAKLFAGIGRSLHGLQRTGFRGGNWQIVGSSALFQAGSLLADWNEAGRWRARAMEMMKLHLSRDFDADGGHGERNWHYGWLSLENMIRLYEQAARSGRLPARDRARFLAHFRRAFRWYLKTVAPGEKGAVLPAYGDGLLQPAERILSAARRFLPERELRARRTSSVLLPASGYAVMRDGTGRYLNVNFGRSGGPHTHADLLDFSLWAFGRPLIEEVGRFGSYDEPLSPTFASPPAHNQLTIDGHEMHRHESEGKGIRWHAGRRIDLFAGWHDAFDDTPPSRWHAPKRVRIHRWILFVRGAYWLVYDLVEPARDAIYTISSWLHSPGRFRIVGPGLARAGQPGGVGCAVAFADPQTLRRLETGSDFLRSEVTGECMYPERHFLRARIWGRASDGAPVQRLAMALLPYRGKPPRVSIRRLPLDGEAPGVLEAFEVRTPFGTDRIVMNPAGKPFKLGRLRSRARAFWSRGSKKEAAR